MPKNFGVPQLTILGNATASKPLVTVVEDMSLGLGLDSCLAICLRLASIDDDAVAVMASGKKLLSQQR
jgi:hypothetical protein